MVSGDEPAPDGGSENVEIERLRAENEQLRAGLARRVRWRHVLAIILVALTSVSVVATSMAIWAHRVIFDTDRFMDAVGASLDDPDFYALIGDRASDSVVEALAIEARITQALEEVDAYLSDALVDALEIDERGQAILERFGRPSLAALAPPITEALETRIDAGIHAFFSSEAFVSRFPELVRRSHQAAVALARDDLASLPNVYTDEGEVRLNLIPFIGEALQRVADDVRAILPEFDLPDALSDRLDEGRDQLAAALEASLPEDFGQVTVMSESALEEVQTVAVQLDRFVWASLAITLVFLVLTMVASPDRRKTAIHLGLAVFVAIVIAVVAIRQLQAAIVAEIIDPRSSALADGLVRNVLAGLQAIQLVIAVAAVLVAIVAYLAGRPKWFVELNRIIGEWTEPTADGSRLDRWIRRHSGEHNRVGWQPDQFWSGGYCYVTGNQRDDLDRNHGGHGGLGRQHVVRGRCERHRWGGYRCLGHERG